MDIDALEADPRYPRPASIFSVLTNVVQDVGGRASQTEETNHTREFVTSSHANSTTQVLRASSANSINWSELQLILFSAYGVVGPLIISIGLVGNTLTLITLLGRTPIWFNSTTYTYLKWLAITDTGALLMAIPMEVRLSMPWRKLAYWEAFYQAHLELPVLNSCMGSSIFIVLCLTGTRFLALFHPARYRSVMHKNAWAKLAVTLAILLAVALSAPLVMLKTVQCEEPRVTSDLVDGVNGTGPHAKKNGSESFAESMDYHGCRAKENLPITHRRAWQVFIVVSECIVRVLPVVTLTFLNAAMIVKFRSVADRSRSIATRSNSRSHVARARHRSKLILLSTVIVLFVCFNSPSAILSIIYKESLESRIGFQIFRAISNDCELANFAVNFYAYFLCSADFRRVFFANFGCLLGRCSTGDSTRTRNGAGKNPSSALGFVAYGEKPSLPSSKTGEVNQLREFIPENANGGGRRGHTCRRLMHSNSLPIQLTKSDVSVLPVSHPRPKSAEPIASDAKKIAAPRHGRYVAVFLRSSDAISPLDDPPVDSSV